MSSDNNVAIKLEGVSKCFQIYEQPHHRLLQGLFRGKKQYFKEFWALKDISFEVKRGEAVGIIGRNGSGKSTLLQLICGTLTPTNGTVETNGRIAALLELGSGFNPEFTGRENVYMNGAVLGLTQGEVDERFDDIAAFADIGQFIDQPVKTYSSGMAVRLAFAVQSQLDPDILIIDEALSVGDFFFQQKCFRFIRSLCEKGVTLLFVSHDMGSVRDLCTSGLYLKKGRQNFFGDNLEAIRRYLKNDNDIDCTAGNRKADKPECPTNYSASLELSQPLWSAEQNASILDSEQKAKILSVGIYDLFGEPTQTTKIGSNIVICVLYRSFCEEPIHVNIVIKNKYDQIVTVMGSYTLKASTPVLKRNQEALFEVSVCPLLEAGNYTVSVNLAHAKRLGTGIVIDETPWLGPIQIVWDYQNEIAPFYGMFGLEADARFFTVKE